MLEHKGGSVFKRMKVKDEVKLTQSGKIDSKITNTGTMPSVSGLNDSEYSAIKVINEYWKEKQEIKDSKKSQFQKNKDLELLREKWLIIVY